MNELKKYEFNIIKNENGIVDVEFICRRYESNICSIDWSESNCNHYFYCQQIADANDHLIEKGY